MLGQSAGACLLFCVQLSEKSQVTFEKREGLGRMVWFPLGGEILALGTTYSILMGSMLGFWRNLRRPLGWYGVSSREESRRLS